MELALVNCHSGLRCEELTMIRWSLPVLALAALFCSSCRESQKPVYPVRGQVLLTGKPIANAFVALHPLAESGPEVPRPTGRTDTDGRFLLTTYQRGDGAPAGEYAVTVEWRPLPRHLPEGGHGEIPNQLPSQYSRPETSGLRVRIGEGPTDLEPLRLRK
jgi:hypothetical protein